MKPQLLILHGALGAKKQFLPLQSSLSDAFDVKIIEFDGHGAGSNFDGEFSISHFAEQTQQFLNEVGWKRPLVFGYSMGGYVALKLEADHHGIFASIVTLGTKFDWTIESAQKETRMLNHEKIAEKVPSFASYLASLHGDNHWRILMEKTAKMMLDMGENPPITETVLAKISIPVSCLLGSEDLMVTEVETKWAQAAIANAIFEKIEGWAHPIQSIPENELATVLARILKKD
ncbi:MAG: alpha/beta hydrolase [Bacteroidota bacterium]